MAFDKNKIDSNLGQNIQKTLLHHGVATPMMGIATKDLSKISFYIRGIMTELGLDLNDDSLIETPDRVAKMYLNEFFWGLDPNNFPKCTTVENKIGYNEMVIQKNITVQSNCEHHLVPIVGYATIAYMPNEKVLGLSKMPRIVDYFCRRPQIQERLTEQIYYALSHVLETLNVAVIINADHFCVRSRGVQDMNSSTITSKLGGAFITDPVLRAEFLSFK